MRKLMQVLILALVAGFIAVGCGDVQPSAQQKEAENRDQNYESLQNKQPAQTMDYSPTRESINQWMEYWEQEGKVSYVYWKAANGQITHYAVLKGLPVSYCAALSPPVDVIDKIDRGMVTVPAQSMDGVYYSGGQCNQYFGFDATTNAYIEFSLGGSQDYFLADQPLAAPEATPIIIDGTTAEEGAQLQKEEDQ